MFYENEVFHKNTITPGSFLQKKHHSVDYDRFRGAVDDNPIIAAG